MNLFQSYLLKYAYDGCMAVEDMDAEAMLQSKLESMLSDMDKPELEHAAPVADKIVEITITKTSADPKVVKSLVNYGLKFAPNLVDVYSAESLKDFKPKLPSTYLPENKDTKPKLVKEDASGYLDDDQAPYHTSTADILSKTPDTALA